MIPKLGGEPLPPAPLCLPKDYRAASAYASQIHKALERYGWSPSQRAFLRNQLRKWTLRAEGRDEHFEQWGTFPPRFPGAPPPTVRDLVIAQWRRRHRQRTTPDERRQERQRDRWRRRSLKVKKEVDPRYRPAAQQAELAEEQDQDEADD
jgi:hypothetical protein